MIFNKTKWVLSSLALQIKEVHLAGLYTKLKYLPHDCSSQTKSCYNEERKENIFWIFFFFTKNDKDEFNTILKHLIKLVKNF